MATWTEGVTRLARLTGWEFFKITSRKLTWLLLLCVVILPWGSLLSTDLAGDAAARAEYLMVQYEAHTGPPTQAQVRAAEAGQARLIAMSIKTIGALPQPLVRAFSRDVTIVYAANTAANVDALFRSAQRAATAQTSGRYGRQAAQMEVRMFKHLPAPGWGDTSTTGLGQSVGFTDAIGFFLMGLAIILSIAPVWPDDRTSGVHRLLRGAMFGRQQTVWAKIFAAALFALAVTVVYSVSNLGAAIATTGFTDWASPLAGFSTFAVSPWNMTLGSFVLVAFAWQTLGNVTLAMLSLLFSAVSRSPLVCAATTVVVYALPLYLYYNAHLQGLNKWLRFDPAFAVKTVELYATFRVVDVLGQPVLLPGIMLLVLLIGCILLAAATWTTWMHVEPE